MTPLSWPFFSSKTVLRDSNSLLQPLTCQGIKTRKSAARSRCQKWNTLGQFYISGQVCVKPVWLGAGAVLPRLGKE